MGDHVLEIELGENASDVGVIWFVDLETSDVGCRRIVKNGQIQAGEHEMKVGRHQANFFGLFES